MYQLSVLIPARRERWLARTVEDVLAHSTAKTEVIVVLDGDWPERDSPLTMHPHLTVVHLPKAIGQRAATNLAARLSQAEFVCKLDAHCSVAPGWDTALIKAAGELGPRVTQIPGQKNLHIYDRVCRTCKKRNYQGPETKACDCGGQCDLDIAWKPRRGVHTTSWRLDSTLHFQYDGDGQRRQREDFCDVMTSLGACFFMTRDFFFEIGGLDEDHGSWGQFGAEIALKTWLSGGRHVVNKRTWFAHFFRVGGIGFPYEMRGSDQEYARTYSRNLWFGNNWPGQVRPLRWLVDKFWPVPGWTEEQRHALPTELRRPAVRPDDPALHGSGDRAVEAIDDGTGRRAGEGLGGRVADGGGAPTHQGEDRALAQRAEVIRRSRSHGIVYYSDCRPDPRILEASRRSIEASGMPIVAVTLQPIVWPAARNIVLPLTRGYETMFRQILAGLEALDADDVFFCEHDLLYSATHFQFQPPAADRYYYNLNVYKVDAATGRALHYLAKQTSGLCADRQLLMAHYRTRVDRVAREGFSRRMGFEPGSHRRPERVDDVRAEEWWSPLPNVDIRHTTNLTPSRWRQDQFRDQRHCQGWTEADNVPGWPGLTTGRFWEWLAEQQRVEAVTA